MPHRQEMYGRHKAFSLVELVMVVVIIGVIAGIAVPRLSSAAHSANSNALQANITNVRKAIDTYYAEHGEYPGAHPTTKAPDGDAFVKQLMLYSDYDGNTQATYGNPFIYGPYLRPPFPVNPASTLTDVYVKATPAAADPGAGTVGWIAVLSHGYFRIASTDADLEAINIIEKVRDIATKE